MTSSGLSALPWHSALLLKDYPQSFPEAKMASDDFYSCAAANTLKQISEIISKARKQPHLVLFSGNASQYFAQMRRLTCDTGKRQTQLCAEVSLNGRIALQRHREETDLRWYRSTRGSTLCAVMSAVSLTDCGGGLPGCGPQGPRNNVLLTEPAGSSYSNFAVIPGS
ncbi:hypothetical protein GOODEAATRI_017680 [Goodea atripinnis]|uniref:Uncharacterized protein n=1 Tax=Goodea atripinnis TaxID=208336 RepID=A0ABV0MSY4_9TELE